MAEQDTVFAVHGEGKLQCIVKDMLIIRDLEIMAINLIGGCAVQLIQHLPVSARGNEGGAERFPADNVGIHDMKSLAAQHRHDNPVGIEGLPLLKDEGSEGVVAESAAAPDRDILRDLFLYDSAHLADRDGVDRHNDLDRLYIRKLSPHGPQFCPERGRIAVLYGEQVRARKAVGLFKNRAGDYKLLGRDTSVIEIAGSGSADIDRVGNHLLHNSPGVCDINFVCAVRENMYKRSPGSVLFSPRLPGRGLLAEGFFTQIRSLKLTQACHPLFETCTQAPPCRTMKSGKKRSHNIKFIILSKASVCNTYLI